MPKKAKCQKCNAFMLFSQSKQDQTCQKCKSGGDKKGNYVPDFAKRQSKSDEHHHKLPSTLVTPKGQEEIWELVLPADTQFEKDHPHYCRNGKICFPIEDSLFDEYSELIKPYHTSNGMVKPIQLPPQFESLLEIWNAVKIFPEYFDAKRNVHTPLDLQLLISNDEEFMNLICKIFDIFIRDFTCDKNQLIKKSEYFDFFSLLKFCIENGLLDKIYTRCWPSLALTVFNFFYSKQELEQNRELIETLKKLSQKCVSRCPTNIMLRLKILSCLMNLLTQSPQFHSMLAFKLQSQKKNHKKLQEIQQKKKKFHKEISKLTDNQRFLQKSMKNLNKNKEDSGEKQRSVALEIQLCRTKKVQLMQQLENLEMEEINYSNQNKNGINSIEYLGCDKNKNFYWEIQQFPDAIFKSSSSTWFYINSQQIQELTNGLNLRGNHQYNLYRNIQEKYGQKNQHEKNNNTNINTNTNVNSNGNVNSNANVNTNQQLLLNWLKQKQMKNAQMSNIAKNAQKTQNQQKYNMEQIYKQLETMLLESESKMTQYLDQRNSRWCAAEEKQHFNEFIKKLKDAPLESVLQFLRNFNQKICVVQTQYKIISQCSAEEIDIKTRKVQTKIWGISEKYKLHWTQFLESIKYFHELFFLIYVLCLNIDKYTSKNRKKRKEFQFVKESNKFIKTNCCRKDQLDWEESCQICKEGGELLCCDICPKVFHPQCLGLSEIPAERFQCENCTKDRNIRKMLRKSKN